MLSNNLFELKTYFLHTIRRYKFTQKFWSPVKGKKTTSIEHAMEYFDDFYASVFGQVKWLEMRKALARKHKYVAVVNNYGDNSATMKFLEEKGAHNLRRLFEAQREFIKNNKEIHNNTESVQPKVDYVEEFARQASKSDMEEIYSQKGDFTIPESMDVGEAIIGEKKVNESGEDVKKSVTNQSLSTSLNTAEYDESRIISANVGMRGAGLWTYVPATKMKGCEDWVPESEHYKYYSSAADYPLTIEEDDDLEFPPELQVYVFESDTTNKFPEPRRGDTGVFDYYLMDGASILPVLALGIKSGDRILDMCAAPGGKSLAAFQTLQTSSIATNDISLSRVKRIKQVFGEYLHDFDSDNKWDDLITITHKDGRYLEDDSGFDKVLIDVPCTTDRHSLKEADNNIFRSSRIKERLRLPEIQSELLCNALKLCKVGGTVVYSTCTLSPIQNDGVVHMGLKRAWQVHGIKATIKIVTNSFEPARLLYKLGTGRAAPKYGQLVMPNVSSNFGPAYFAKMVKTQE